MNLRDLQYIIAVAETRHFGKAADKCFVSQPTLSGQIKKLEDELGIVIFERNNRSVEITPVGEAILQHARNMLEQSEAIRQLAIAHRDPLSGPLRIGIIPTLSSYLLPLILMPLKQQHPQLSLVLSEEMTAVLLKRLVNYELDAIILATPVDDSDLVATALFDEPFWVAYSADHPFYLKQNITKKDLQQENLLLLSEGNCLSEQIMTLLDIDRDRSGKDMIGLRASSLETLIQFVSAGFGVTLVPALALRGPWSTGIGVAVQALSMKGASRRVNLVSRSSFPRSAALTALAEIIKSQLPNTVHTA